MRASFWIVWALVPACSSVNTTSEQHPFNDDAGRMCQATLEKASVSGSLVTQSVSCDGSSRSCSTESTSCFVLSVDSETLQVRNCPACCKGTSSSFYSADCATVVCATDADCIYTQATCSSGVCSCPPGVCD